MLLSLLLPGNLVEVLVLRRLLNHPRDLAVVNLLKVFLILHRPNLAHWLTKTFHKRLFSLQGCLLCRLALNCVLFNLIDDCEQTLVEVLCLSVR